MSFFSKFIPTQIDCETQLNIDFFSNEDALFSLINVLSENTSFYFNSEQITTCYVSMLEKSYEYCQNLQSIKNYLEKFDKINVSTKESNNYFRNLKIGLTLLRGDTSLLNSQEMKIMLGMMNDITIIAKGTTNILYDLIYKRKMYKEYADLPNFINIAKNSIIDYIGINNDRFFNSWWMLVDPFYSTYLMSRLHYKSFKNKDLSVLEQAGLIFIIYSKLFNYKVGIIAAIKYSQFLTYSNSNSDFKYLMGQQLANGFNDAEFNIFNIDRINHSPWLIKE